MTPGDSGADEPAPGSAAARALTALATYGDADLQEIVNLVRAICDVDQAAVSIHDGGKFHMPVTAGMEPFVCAAEESLCLHTMSDQDTVLVADASLDARFRGSPYVDGQILATRFYASAPLWGPDDVMLGRLCVLDGEPRTLDDLQAQALDTLAANASQVIQFRIRQAEDERHRAEHVAASEEVLRVAAQISHDLRVPLTALSTALDMLDEAEPPGVDAVRRRIFTTARRSAQRMSKMIEEIMHLHEVDRAVSFREVDLAAVARQVVDECDGTLHAAGASVTVGAMPTVYADGDLMYSLLLNLVTNAVKFARPGVPPVIVVSARRVDDGWRLSVVDNGIGIPAERRSEVFAMFSRLSSAVAGHGIGLATVARIADVHGGTVGVASPPGPGTEIWVHLPDRQPG